MVGQNTIINADAAEALKLMPDESVDCCVTSPPYFGLRDYGCAGQIGLEDDVEQYIRRLVDIFREVRRVLKNDGTLWVNIADSYAGSRKGSSNYPDSVGENKQGTNKGMIAKGLKPTEAKGCKPKDLIGVPWMLAFALRADGWYLRQDIIWEKPNPMPESVKDRCTKSHEYIFLLSKSRRYYFNAEAIAEPVAASTLKRLAQDVDGQTGSFRQPGKANGPMKAVPPRYGGKKYTENPSEFNRTKSGNLYEPKPLRNKRDVWRISTKPFKGAHFATFPVELIEPCILAGCPKGGTVLDPFAGSGTTGVAAKRQSRQYILIELSPKYTKLAEDRLKATRRGEGEKHEQLKITE